MDIYTLLKFIQKKSTKLNLFHCLSFNFDLGAKAASSRTRMRMRNGSLCNLEPEGRERESELKPPESELYETSYTKSDQRLDSSRASEASMFCSLCTAAKIIYHNTHDTRAVANIFPILCNIFLSSLSTDTNSDKDDTGQESFCAKSARAR